MGAKDVKLTPGLTINAPGKYSGEVRYARVSLWKTAIDKGQISQVYSITVLLEVPDSPGNEELGMFMACINVTGQDGAAITRSCKSSISQYRSPMLRSIETLAFAPVHLIGWTEQEQNIPVTFFANFLSRQSWKKWPKFKKWLIFQLWQPKNRL